MGLKATSINQVNKTSDHGSPLSYFWLLLMLNSWYTILTHWENLVSCALVVQNRQERVFIRKSSPTVRNLLRAESQETVDPKAPDLTPLETVG